MVLLHDEGCGFQDSTLHWRCFHVRSNRRKCLSFVVASCRALFGRGDVYITERMGKGTIALAKMLISQYQRCSFPSPKDVVISQCSRVKARNRRSQGAGEAGGGEATSLRP